MATSLYGAGFGPQITPLNPQNLKSEINTDSDRWSVTLNVKYFAPEDLKVKTVGASVEVKAKHEEKQDEAGAISRDFVRKYHLPEGVDPTTVESHLTYDGMLIISAPMPNASRSRSGPSETVPLKFSRM